MSRTPTETNEAADESRPGVPGFRSWTAVYVFVLTCFGLGVAFLTWFTRAFS